MSKIDEYRRGLKFCEANAAKAPYRELQDIWQTIGESYAFLIEIESRPRVRVYGAAKWNVAGGVLFRRPPADDRIRL